jgi:hypothetical protein
MRTPFKWTLPRRTSLRLLCACCACCALWGVPAAALGAPEQIAPAPVVSTPPPAATPSTVNDDTAGLRGVLLDWRVWTFIAVACLFGMIAGWATKGPPEPRVRLLNKPKKTRPSVLVPPGPAPRLIPGDSPKATRSRAARAPVPRQTPDATTGSGIVDYIAPFSDAGKASERGRVDYILDSGDSQDDAQDSSLVS